jgi:WD40 repeat protein
MAANSTWSYEETVIRRFESVWRRGERPDLGAFITPAVHSTGLLIELAHIDLEFRLRAGEPARVEDYVTRFPELAVRDVVLDLIVTEFGLRRRSDPAPEPAEYYARFPGYHADVARLLKSGNVAALRSSGGAAAEPVGAPVVPGCEVGEELGRGGMGVVYKAFQPALGRTVAVKTLVAADAQTVDRFRREAETVARLDHPHVVPVYEVGAWDAGGRAVPYFVMKYYPGVSLDAAPCGPGTDLPRHARTVEAVARAVHHAHQRGVLHRDLKPSNILLDEAGRPHVTDFGLAGRFDPSDPSASPGGMVGTPAYMAPEQAHDPARVTTAADVYGLGAVLYQLLTGRPPFRGPTALATLELLGRADPDRPSSINPAVPRDLEAVCLKCLAKDPEQRYPSADAVAEDLRRWLTGRPVIARPVSTWGRTRLWARRHPVQAALTALTAVAVGVTAVSLVVGGAVVARKEKEASTALERERKAAEQLGETLGREQEALYLERVSAAGRLYAANQLPQAWRLLDACSCDARRWEWHALDRLRRTAPPPLGEHPEWVTGAAFLADGRLVTADLTGELRVWDVDGKKEQKAWSAGPPGATWTVRAHPTRPWFAVAEKTAVVVWDADAAKPVHRVPSAKWAAFDPTGVSLAVGVGPQTRVYATADWGLAREFTGHDRDVLAGTFSPDGKRLITAGADRTVRSWDVGSGSAAGVWPRRATVLGLSFTADGASLLEDRGSEAVVTDAADGVTLGSFPLDGRRHGLAVGPDPRTAAVSGPVNEVQVLDLETRRAVRVFRGHTGPPGALAFSRDGRRLASAGGDRAVRVWELDRTPECVTLPVVPGMRALAVAPGGRLVAVVPAACGDMVVFDTAASREAFRVPGAGGVAFGPDGSWLAAGGRDGGVTVYAADTGSPKWSAAGGGTATARVAASPDGRWVAAADSTGGVRVWGAAGRDPVASWPEPRGAVYGLAFAAGRLVVAGAGGCVARDVATGATVWVTAPVAMAVAADPDGARVATVEMAHRVQLRDAATGELVRSFEGVAPDCGSLAFSPDGRRLVTGGYRTVRVWTTDAGRELLTLPGAGAKTAAVAWVGNRVYALDDRVRVWPGGSD